jgi:hypothetical protein
MCVRARLAEEVVERAVAAGTRQYAILGASLDSFAYRRPDLLGRLLMVPSNPWHLSGGWPTIESFVLEEEGAWRWLSGC